MRIHEAITAFFKGAALSFVEEETEALRLLSLSLLLAPLGGLPSLSPLESLKVSAQLLESGAVSQEELEEALQAIIEGTFEDPWMRISEFADLS